MSLPSALLNFGVIIGLVQVSSYLKIGERDDIKYVEVLLFCDQNKSTLKYTPPATAATPDPEQVVTTVQEYDNEQLTAFVKQSAMSIATVVAIHAYMKFAQPLFLQIFLPWKTLYSAPLFQVYMLNQPAVGTLKRPWTTASPLGFEQPKAEDKIENKIVQEVKAEEKKTQ